MEVPEPRGSVGGLSINPYSLKKPATQEEEKVPEMKVDSGQNRGLKKDISMVQLDEIMVEWENQIYLTEQSESEPYFGSPAKIKKHSLPPLSQGSFQFVKGAEDECPSSRSRVTPQGEDIFSTVSNIVYSCIMASDFARVNEVIAQDFLKATQLFINELKNVSANTVEEI